ncbi:MAG: hypothetical protein RR630_08745 [Coprobacillus sp.]
MKNYYLQALDMLIYLLDKNGNYDHWIEWLKIDMNNFIDMDNVDHHIQAYGGMGSFNDLHLSKLDKEENLVFDIMKQFCYEITFYYKRIHKDMKTLEKEVLNEVLYKNKEKREAVFILILDGLQSGDFLTFYKHGQKYKNIKDIVFYRDSVCMGDDMNENTRTYPCHVNLPYTSLLTIVKEYNFLAQISGNDVVWVALNSHGKELFSYFTKSDKLIKITNKVSIDDVCEGTYKIYFKYYTSPIARGYQLFKEYHGDGYQMWHDGVQEEYLCCSISKKQEEEWRKEL